MEQIYLDYNATTPIDAAVANEMRPYLEAIFGNPSSGHEFGLKARVAVEKARSRVAGLINAKPQEIVFTSGGTESNNMAIKGAAYAMKAHGNHIIISAVEHPAVSEVTSFLSQHGFKVSVAPVDEYGMIDPGAIKGMLLPETILISVMHANNEVGTIQPIAEIAQIARRHGALMHTDAAQSTGKIPVDVKLLEVDLLSIAGHKLYAPKGVGALYIRHGVKIEKLMHGANHEQNLRAGTENVLEIVGLGKACELAHQGLGNEIIHLSQLKGRLLTGLQGELDNFRVNGHPVHCLPNTLSLSFLNLNAVSIIQAMAGVAASAGAACHTGDDRNSGVLGAMRVPPEYAAGTIRFSVGRNTTANEIDHAIDIIIEAVRSFGAEAPPAEVPTDTKEEIRLTRFTHGLGCACKMRPADLETVLAKLPPVVDPNVLISASKRDDAAVYRISDQLAVVQTLDFFTPIVDDPYQFGAIAAANALSDVYAMGARPVFALNIAAFPVNRLPLSVLEDIMRGASDKASEAGMSILGGHSIEDNEPKFGMAVTGLIDPAKLISNAGAKPGDVLVLTKPIGTGIISTAFKQGLAETETMQAAIAVMTTLNKVAAEQMVKFKVHACTDVTGFGLLGHLHEMTQASMVNATINFNDIPLIEGVADLALAGAVPGGTHANVAYAGNFTKFGSASPGEKAILCDAQTSGGLLISLSLEEANMLLKSLNENGISASIIGNITGKGHGEIQVVF
ncbi:MAG: selenide, water dikinase SelD [Lentimicrobium sp.]|jgi:cysteine desulfurase NifS/selenium donor protein|nr:selenide, water dikinase SelD [Lentimicrobium sp.]